ncbi:UGSC family (seleno)protein [Halorientalis litorea]|uniref:UGSC family (seleno)protein n=1 Tax=Halorientalis litorea TaxID=2931977 RepID=UPI001FF2CF1C|nr:UGSC family (seleno)protein [Halorientalis litorea]
MSESDEILDPTPSQSGTDESVLTDRPATLDGASIGLLSNAKKNSDHFLQSVGTHLQSVADIDVSDVVYKPTATSAAPDDIYEELGQYDAVLTAYGDCGSCSSWTIHDAIQLEESGIPTVVFCSEEFTTLCQFESENQSCPGLPIVEFEHPIADVAPEVVREERVTDAICDEVVEALTSDPETLRDRYGGRYTDEV